MSKCQFDTVQIDVGKWRHTCRVCRESFVIAASRYIRACGAAAKSPKNILARTAPCAHLGAVIRTETCQLCGNRGKIRTVNECVIWGTCTPLAYRAAQPEQRCKGCEQYQPSDSPMPPLATDEFGIPIPANLTPLPAGRVFNGPEWRGLREEERDYYRAVRRAREGTANPAPVAPAAGSHDLPRDKTPFFDVLDRPIFLSNYGQGASAFLILGGPSLLDCDLSKLHRRGIFTMAVNNSATLHRPNSWIFVDSPGKFHDSIWRDPAIIKFTNKRFLNRSIRTRNPDGSFANFCGSDGRPVLIKELPSVVAFDRNADFNPPRWLQEPSINWGMSKKSAKRGGNRYPQTLNSMFAAIKTLYAIGFRVIYLLGCDFQMREDQPYAFPQTKAAGGVRGNNSSYQKVAEMLGALKPYFDAAGLHVFNCNKISGLTHFPHVPYETAIATATRGLESGEVLRADGWYNGHAGD